MRVAPERLDRSEQVGVALSQNPSTAATASTVTLYSADGLIAVQEDHDGVVADVPQVVCSTAGDDDLTSLTWLQDKNLLKKGVPELPKHEFTDGNASDSTLSNSSASSSSSSKANANVIPRISYDPYVHITSKPPFSFSCLIFMAIENSDDKALPVKDIYVWILDNFPYYRNAPTGWKNSVRHNLSLNKCFKKVDKSPNLGKGSLWMVEQRFRPCLVQALQKTPYNHYQKFIRNLNNNNNNNNNHNNNNSSSNNNSHNDSSSNSIKNMISDTDTCDIDCKDGIRIFSDGKDGVRIFVEESNVVPTSLQNDIPATPTPAFTPTISLKDHTDEVDAAATAMLVLKHGACAFDIKAENLNVDFRILETKREVPDEKSDLANRPNDDHNYGYHNYSGSSDNPDDDKMNSYWHSAQEEMEERRKIVEGADALLNLAGITTYNTRKRSLSLLEEQQPNMKQSRSESLTEFEERLRPTRKERTMADNYYDTSEKEEEVDEGSDTNSKRSPNVNSHEERQRTQKNRASTTSNRRLRRKIEKKRFKL